MSSPLPAVVVGLLGFARHRLTFMLFHLAILVGSLLLTLRAVQRRTPGTEWLLLAVFIAAPISTVTFAWLGQPDVAVVGLGAALVFLRRPVVVAGVAALLALCSFEQGVYVVVTVGLVGAPLVGARRWPHTAAAVLGLLAGRVLLSVYQSVFGIEQATTRWGWLQSHGIRPALVSQVSWWPLVLLSMFSAAWVFVVWWFRSAEHQTPLAQWLLVAFAVGLVPMTLGYDHSRVFSITSWPLLVAMVVWAGENIEASKVRDLVRVLLPVGIAVPAVLVGTPAIYSVAWPAIVQAWG